MIAINRAPAVHRLAAASEETMLRNMPDSSVKRGVSVSSSREKRTVKSGSFYPESVVGKIDDKVQDRMQSSVPRFFILPKEYDGIAALRRRMERSSSAGDELSG